MKKLLFSLLIISLLISCNSKKGKTHFLSPANLTSQFFSVDPTKDTALRTLHGAIIKVPAGVIKASPDKRVNFEIKEALIATEIIQAGLLSESNGKPLQSAGMIYINATADGKNVDLIKPLPVSLPAKDFNPAMKIFKGEITKDSIINWVDPYQPDTILPAQMIEAGKTIFMSKCASCHNIFKAMTGPPLMKLEEKGPWTKRKNIYSYIHNPYFFEAHNKYVQDLRKVYGSVMLAYPNMDNKAIDAILLYIKSEELKYNDQTVAPMTEKNTANPCGYDTTVNTIEEIPDYIRGSKADTGKKDIPVYDTTGTTDYTADNFVEPDTATFTMPQLTEQFEENVYQFEIQSFGWYNVDAFIEGYPGLTDIKVSGTLIGKGSDREMTVYLFCPAKKFSQYVINQDGDRFDFNKKTEGLPFFLNERVILFAVNIDKGTASYGIKEFFTKKEQIIDLEIKQCSEKELLDKIKSIKLEGVDLKDVKKEIIITPIPCDQKPEKDSSRVVKKDTIVRLTAKPK